MPRRLAAHTYPLLPFAAFLVLFAAERAAYCQGMGDPFNAPGSTTSNIRGYENHNGTMVLITVFSENAKTRLDTLQKDPAAVQFNISDGAMPPKARKEAKHGVSALKSGKWNEANKRLDAALKLAPDNRDVNFLLGYLYFQKKDFGRAADFLGNATTMSPENVQALTLLGRLRLQQEDYGGAASNLEKAVLADAEYWAGHDLLPTPV